MELPRYPTFNVEKSLFEHMGRVENSTGIVAALHRLALSERWGSAPFQNLGRDSMACAFEFTSARVASTFSRVLGFRR